MAFTKAQLIADLQSRYKVVGTPESQASGVVGVNYYIVNVLELGKSSVTEKQTAYSRNVHFYVFHEGQGDEDAYYKESDPGKSIDDGLVVAVTSLAAVSKIYGSSAIRIRILGWIINKVIEVTSESEAVAHHSMRLKWANDAIQNPEKYLNAYMCLISQSPDVQAAGNLSTDADFAWLGYMVNGIAIAFGFTD